MSSSIVFRSYFLGKCFLTQFGFLLYSEFSASLHDMNKSYLIVVIQLSSIICLSQPAVVNQSTEWFVLNSNAKLHKRVGFTFDAQFRFVRGMENAQHFVRNGLEVYITPKLSIVPIGYMYVWNFRYGEQPSTFANNEQRLWQQVMYKHNIKKFYFSHRLRLEQRFIERRYIDEISRNEVYDGYATYLNRVRYRFQVQFPINKEKIEPGALFGAFFDEVFYSWGENISYNKPDQNRLYAGIGYQFDKKLSIQGGAFYQVLLKSNGTKQESNIGVLAQFTYNFDFTTKDN
jgi:hypothetical protein